MEQQNRKRNRLESYDYSQNGAYFITICTQDREPILSAIVGDGKPVPYGGYAAAFNIFSIKIP